MLRNTSFMTVVFRHLVVSSRSQITDAQVPGPTFAWDQLEIPLSLPRDGSLRFLGHTPKEILSLWKLCANSLADAGGVVVLLTHCESRFSGNPGNAQGLRVIPKLFGGIAPIPIRDVAGDSPRPE